jgi:hypothetical protein
LKGESDVEFPLILTGDLCLVFFILAIIYQTIKMTKTAL